MKTNDTLDSLRDQWEDVISITNFVAEQLVEEAKSAHLDDLKQLLDGLRSAQSTIRAARKVSAVLGWLEEEI